MIKIKLNNNAKKIDRFLLKFLKKQKKTILVAPMKYGLISGGKKIRSKIILDAGKLFKVKEKKLLDCIKSNTFFAINEKNCATKDTINPTIKAVTTKARFDLSILK